MRIRIFVAVLISAIFFYFTAVSQAVEYPSLAYLAAKNKAVKVFVNNFTSDDKEGLVTPEIFKKSFESSLLNRKSMTFEIVSAPASSDIQISGVIKKYLYSEKDPITTYASPTGLLLDAATTENYAELTIDFDVVETSSGKTIWKGAVSSFIKKMMTPEESVPIICDKVSRTFMWKCFGKPSASAR